MLSKHEVYPVAVVCQVLGLARSSYYYRVVEKDVGGEEEAIEEVGGTYPT